MRSIPQPHLNDLPRASSAWLRFLWSCALLLLIVSAPASALLGLEVGVRAGSMTYSGDLFGGSDEYRGDQLGTGICGAVRLGITTLPVIDIVADLGYTQRSSFAIDVATDDQRAYDFSDVALNASLRVAIFDPPLSPLSVYLGAGVGMHWIPALPSAVSVEGGKITTVTSAEPAALFLGGARFDPPALPFAVFVEGSIEGIFGAGDVLRASSVSAGFTLGL